MPAYSFQLSSHLAGRAVSVVAAGSSTVVASGTLDGSAKFAADLPVGDYVAAAGDGRYAYQAAGTVDQGDGDRLSDGALGSAFGRRDLAPKVFAGDFASYSKGGRVGTSGRIPVAIRFDDWQDQIISLGIITELNNRGLFGSIALCTTLGANPWSQVITYDTLRTWNRTYGMEMWSHGTDHNSPYSANAATFTANLKAQIESSKAKIEAEGMRCMGWAMPGVSAPGYNAPGTFMLPSDFDTEAGQMFLANYGLVETDMTDKFRFLPGGARYGLGHFTVSDGKTLQQSKDVLDGAINLGFGLEFMCHAGNLGLAGNATYADFKALLDYIVTKRDAGLIEVVAPSTLPFCDPSSTRRLDLIGNNGFEAAVPLAATTVIGNWRNVDGTARYVTSVAAGPTGATTNVLHCSGSTLVNQVAERVKGRGIAGQALLLDAWVRCIQVSTVTNSSVRFVASDSDNIAQTNFDVSIPVDTNWKHIRVPFGVNPATDNLSFGFGRGSTVGSGQIEWDDVHVYVA